MISARVKAATDIARRWLSEWDSMPENAAKYSTKVSCIGIADVIRALVEAHDQLASRPEEGRAKALESVATAARNTLIEQRREFARGEIEDLDQLEDALGALDSMNDARQEKP